MNSKTVTFYYPSNYGALLQCYALQHTLNELGLENEVIDLAVESSIYIKVNLKNIKAAISSLYINWLTFIKRKKIKSLRNSFIDFKNKYIKTTLIYSSMEELRNDPPLTDLLITGSDQVWNMSLYKNFIPARFLDFGSTKCKRISYAASIESMNFSELEKDYVKNRLSCFSNISVREQSAKKYIQSIIDKDCEVVLDPVFLLNKEEWNKISKPPRLGGNYILCYQVRGNKRMQNVANYIKEKTGLPIVAINNSAIEWIKADFNFYNVSPEEFLGFYRNASYVVAASFHGSAFGIIYNKPTYCLIKKSTRNRMFDLFQSLNLSEYIIDENTNLNDLCLNSKNVSAQLQKEISHSLAFIKKSISQIEN